jgi:hypothetical protein
MANVQVSSFGPTAATSLIAGLASTNVILPTTGTPTVILVTNMGVVPAYVLLGTSNAVVVTSATGLPIMPGKSIYLTVGSNTYLAAIAAQTTPLSIVVGN